MTKLTTLILALSLSASIVGCGEGVANGSANNSQPPTNNPQCTPLPAPAGNTITVNSSQAQQLGGIVASANQGDTILLEDGNYNLDGSVLWFSTPGVTLRSAS